jgi:hypothetical protein
VKTDGKWHSWEDIFGPVPPVEINVTAQRQASILAKMEQAVGLAGLAPQMQNNSPQGPAGNPTTPCFTTKGPIKRMGIMGVLAQGHHPLTGSYPTPSRGTGLGNVKMSSRVQFGPWGSLATPYRILLSCLTEFDSIGFPVTLALSDDDCTAAALRRTASGGSNVFNNVNLGLFAGHSVAGRDTELSAGYLQSYVPIYNKTANTMTFVKSSQMIFGSANLKWMAFYSCNLFRDGAYRPNGIYDEMKNNLAIPMNSQLHILQGYATEMSVHHDMARFWRQALGQKTGNPADYTVVGAWKYVCVNTQPTESPNDANVCRSIYWPECAGDYIYGWGPQTNPSGGDQSNLQEEDLRR